MMRVSWASQEETILVSFLLRNAFGSELNGFHVAHKNLFFSLHFNWKSIRIDTSSSANIEDNVKVKSIESHEAFESKPKSGIFTASRKKSKTFNRLVFISNIKRNVCAECWITTCNRFIDWSVDKYDEEETSPTVNCLFCTHTNRLQHRRLRFLSI